MKADILTIYVPLGWLNAGNNDFSTFTPEVSPLELEMGVWWMGIVLLYAHVHAMDITISIFW